MKVNFIKSKLAGAPIFKLRSYKQAMLFLFVFLFLFSLPTFSAAPSVAVIYPELREPFNKIFTDMAEGVEKEVNGRTLRYILEKDYSQEKLNQWIRKNNIKVCVALGVRSEKATSTMGSDIPVVLGGVLTPKSNVNARSGISLAPSPDKLFGELKKLKPNTKEIIVVYNPNKTEWLIRRAQSAATKHRLELVTYSTKSLSESARFYRDIFKRPGIKNAAIWLPPDASSVDNRAVLSFILDQSWKKGTAVFSSSLSHVNKGVLFAMYPDNTRLGQSLGRVAMEELNGASGRNKEVVPVSDLQTAFNKRTAEHLGISITSAELRSYDAVFPSE